jgi:glycosyltransferase involved in cell wall biosynthesis
VLKSWAPDLVFVWGMWAMSREVAAGAEALLPGRVVYYISDYWPADRGMHTAYWEGPARHPAIRIFKKLFAPFARRIYRRAMPSLRFEHPLLVSRRVRDILLEKGVPLQDPVVVHCGTDLDRFRGIEPARPADGPLRLLFAGQMTADKGAHTAVEALGKLVESGHGERVSLTLIGSGHPDYEQRIRDLIASRSLAPHIRNAEPVAREAFPSLLAGYDVLIFPSIYEEPFARVIQEAMAAGLVVIGTATGGTPEILEDGVNGLVFPPGDAEALAAAVVRLLSTEGLAGKLAAAGRKTVFERFDQRVMVDAVETYLENVLKNA